MKLDIFKLIDILAVAAVALAWSHPVWAQDDVAVKACETQASKVKVDHPGKFIQARDEEFGKCLASKISDPQRRTLALRKNVEFVCNDTADNEAKRDGLTTAERAKVYGRCLKGHGYVQ